MSPAFGEFADIYQKYKRAVVRVAVRDSSGTVRNGAGFHIGGGFIVTARHVVEQPIEGVYDHWDKPVAWTKCLTPSAPSVDLAILETAFSPRDFLERTTIRVGDRVFAPAGVIPIGGHLDDWLGDELVLSRVLVLGFPRVPLSQDTSLVAVLAEVNAIADRYDVPHPHFIISAVPRGGFSGGPAISEYGFLLGVVTHSLIEDGNDTTAGLMAVLSVEPLWNLLHEKAIYPPGENGDFLRGLYG